LDRPTIPDGCSPMLQPGGPLSEALQKEATLSGGGRAARKRPLASSTYPGVASVMIEQAGSRSTQSAEPAIPRDTSHEAWEVQMAALRRLGPAGRVAVAVDLSESVRALQFAGIEAVHPEWSRTEVVRRLVRTQYGIELPRGR
jgi:hypothetical protein